MKKIAFVFFAGVFFYFSCQTQNNKPAGHGVVDGSSGEIIYELESLSSAWGIIKNASLTVK